MNTFLHIFLIFDVFLVGVVAGEALRHALDHLRPAKPVPQAVKPASGAKIDIPPEMEARLLQTSQAHFMAALDHSAAQLQRELNATAERLNHSLEQMGTEVVSQELEHYQAELTQLRQQAESNVGAIREQIAAHEQELRAKIAEELAAEKQKLVQQIDTKLADAVSSFLVETLQHNVDLGAQAAYISSVLEEHKAELIKGVASEDPVA